MKRRPTDKERLDWLDRIAAKATPGGWFVVLYDGAVIREDRAGNRDGYDGEARPRLRAAIDAAMAAERRGDD